MSMIHSRMKSLSMRLAAVAALGLVGGGLASSADAALIATDHFLTGNPAVPANGEYTASYIRPSNASGAGQNPTIAGFTGQWVGNVTSGTSMAVAQWKAESGSLIDITVPYQDGGRAKYYGSSGVNSLQRRVQRELSPYTPSDTYYMSLITQIATGDLAGADGFVGVGFTNYSGSAALTDASIVGGSNLRGVLIGAASSDGSTTDFVVRHVGSTGAVQNDVITSNVGSIEATQTIIKIEFNDDPGNLLGNSKLTIWQNPADLSSELGASASVTPLELRTFALGTNADITHLMLTGLNYSKAASFDEPRLATTWAEAVPEPATAGLLAVMGLGLMVRRQRTH
jgi:hypothetical protein